MTHGKYLDPLGWAVCLLLLVSCNGGAVATDVESPLDGTEWSLVSLHGEGLLDKTQITLYFEEGHLGGKAGCNGYGGGPDGGSYGATEEGELSVILPMAITAQLCSEPEGIMEQEADYIDALLRVGSFQVVDDQLELYDRSGERVLIFTEK